MGLRTSGPSMRRIGAPLARKPPPNATARLAQDRHSRAPRAILSQWTARKPGPLGPEGCQRAIRPNCEGPSLSWHGLTQTSLCRQHIGTLPITLFKRHTKTYTDIQPRWRALKSLHRQFSRNLFRNEENSGKEKKASGDIHREIVEKKKGVHEPGKTTTAPKIRPKRKRHTKHHTAPMFRQSEHRPTTSCSPVVRCTA
jgi:hypothetical protein